MRVPGRETKLLTKLFKLLFAAFHEEKKAIDAITKRNKEIDKQQEEAKRLFDEIAREIELTCGQGTIYTIRVLGISIESRERHEIKNSTKGQLGLGKTLKYSLRF